MKKFLYIHAIIPMLLAACAGEIEPQPPRPVIEGWIDSDGYPVVMFTSSLSPDAAGGNLSDMMIRWGRVTISDGERTVIMTGGLNHDFLPPYRYYTFEMKGQPGRTYTVTADYEDLRAKASCTMPEPTAIDSIVFRPAENNDSLRTGTLYFTAPANCPAYYNVEIRQHFHGGRPYPVPFGTVTATTPGKKIAVPLSRPKNALDTVPYEAQFRVGEQLEISLCHIDPQVYDFWHAYGNDVMFGHSVFLGGSQSLPTNISGGYGVWSARGTSKESIEIR